MRIDRANGLQQGRHWHVNFGSLRWLILGTLGVGHACGGRTDVDFPEQSGQDNSSAQGGASGTTGSTASTGWAGNAWVGTSGSASIADAGGVAGTGANAPSPCVFSARASGGADLCENGLLHRVNPEGRCASVLPRPDPFPSAGLRFPLDAGIDYACLYDDDCTAQPYGHCEVGQSGPYCAYGCRVDSDCNADELCLCEDPVGRCVPATCHSDAQCGSGLLCAINVECYTTTFSCQQPTDECAVSSDCSPGQSCIYERDAENPSSAPVSGRRVCQLWACPVIGRPFLVEGSERLAPAARRGDWYGDATPTSAPHVTPELARAIAAGWTEQALMEHASVAAFARFVLQLLSLGAPAELVSDASRAMQDEIRHARACFALARRHLSADLGPGPLPMHGALAESSLHEIVLTTVLEGCIGETVAALEASEALAHCVDAEARAVLERIAVEEGQHAQLAWRFVAWALREAPAAQRPALRASVEQLFHAELEAATTGSFSSSNEHERELLQHGLLSPSSRAALRQRALRDVVAPCAEALLSPGPGTRHPPAAELLPGLRQS